MLDLRNLNTIWSTLIATTLVKLGVKTVIISPGSRSTPLTLAFAQNTQVESIPILDERSAAFFALGRAKAENIPVVLICTSGTAAANFYPAIIEAKYSGVPLIVLTADRPPELRHCQAGQTIDQVKLYGNYPKWQVELALPGSDLSLLEYLRNTIIQAWERSISGTPGVVHLNCPFREPLAPEDTGISVTIPAHFLDHITCSVSPSPSNFILPKQWRECTEGIIIAGLAQPQQPEAYCRAIAQLGNYLGWPILAEALSPVRNYAGIMPHLITTYDFILRQPCPKIVPKTVIQIGELPTSKRLRQWLSLHQPQRWVITETEDNLDPLHGQTIYLRQSITNFSLSGVKSPESGYQKLWSDLENHWRQKIGKTLTVTDNFFEGKAAWLLSQYLPKETPIFFANSMPVRYAEFFWQAGDRRILPYFSRGANGIDGTLGTAMGIAHNNQSTVLLTGDLALLHDTNSFLVQKNLNGHLTVILINNQGGGIFEHLPIANFRDYFEEFFATPQKVDFAQLCSSYGVEYKLIADWSELRQLINPLPSQGVRVLELLCDRQADRLFLENFHR